MKKKTLILCICLIAVLAVATAGILIGTGVIDTKPHKHTWLEATCSSPRLCQECGATEGEALAHNWKQATCEEPKTCSVCNTKEGNALGHIWSDTTCTDAKTCSVCNATDGEALGHTWDKATCTEPKTCTVCNYSEGAATGHDWKNATCTESKTCKTCGVISGSPKGHKWKSATCTEPKTCSVCNYKEGEASGHDWKNATCTKPKTCKSCGVTNGKSKGHSYENGTCEACGSLDIKLQKMAALGINTGYNSAKFPSTLRLNTVTFEDRINGYGDPITRMVIRCYAANSLGGYGYLYVVVLCCEYETDYINFEWGGLFFRTSTYSNDPGMCDYTLNNKNAMDAYNALINDPKNIPYD